MKTKLKLLSLFFILNACAYGPTQEKKSPLNYLNGEHYEQSANIFGVPVIERKTKNTKISGKIQMDDPFAKLSHETQLSLISNSQIISTVQANTSGSFQFQGTFPNGDYLIRATAPLLSGEVSIKVNDYDIKDILVVMYKSQKQIGH